MNLRSRCVATDLVIFPSKGLKFPGTVSDDLKSAFQPYVLFERLVLLVQI